MSGGSFDAVVVAAAVALERSADDATDVTATLILTGLNPSLATLLALVDEPWFQPRRCTPST